MSFETRKARGREAEVAVCSELQKKGVKRAKLPAPPVDYSGSADIEVGSVVVEVKRRGFPFTDVESYRQHHPDAIVDGCDAFDKKLEKHHVVAVVVVSDDMEGTLVFPTSKMKRWEKRYCSKYRKLNYHAPLEDAEGFDELVESLKDSEALDVEIDELLEEIG